MTDRHATSAPIPATGPARAMERRRSVRHPLGATGTVTFIGPDTTDPRQLQVLVMNVSLHGVGFRSPVEFAPGETFEMRIGTGPLHLSSRFEVVSSRSRGDGTWDVGGRFV